MRVLKLVAASLFGLSYSRIILKERFDIGRTKEWIQTSIEVQNQIKGAKKLLFDHGNLGKKENDSENGIYTSEENSTFGISTCLDEPYSSLANLSLKFDVRKEKATTESLATIKLFGHEGHAAVLYHLHYERIRE